MSKSTKPKVPEKADDKEQSKAFIESAQEVETDDSREAFEKAFKKVVGANRGSRSKEVSSRNSQEYLQFP